MPGHTQEIAPKETSASKAAKASLEGLHGVFRHLAEEHGEVAMLLNRVQATAEPHERAKLFAKIRVELLSHEQGELREVYPVFADHPELVGMMNRHDVEAMQMQQLIGRLYSAQAIDAAWGRSLDELVRQVAAHVKEEEEEIFPEAMRVLGREEAERMLPRYQAAKEETRQKL